MRDAPLASRWIPFTRALAVEAIATLLFLGAVMASFARFVVGVEARPGVVLADPLLARLPVIDATWLVFGALYGAIVVVVALLVRRPARLLAGCQAYALMVLLRMLVMWAAPLDPPPAAIPLVDPIVALFGPPAVMTRDLFFSGHTATATMLALAAPTRRARTIVAALAAFIAAGVLLQHVHYAIDVFVAPLAALFAWRVTLRLRVMCNRPAIESSEASGATAPR